MLANEMVGISSLSQPIRNEPAFEVEISLAEIYKQNETNGRRICFFYIRLIKDMILVENFQKLNWLIKKKIS